MRVLIVDDTDDVRLLLHIQFESDPRFTVVASGANGEEAIALAEAHQPDLVILDRRMPVLGGLEALPRIRDVAPEATVVLYTAEDDTVTRRAALAAGALDVLGKDAGLIVDRLVDALVSHGQPDDDMEIRVGPVSSEAAAVWVENTRRIVNAVAAHPDVLAEPLPEDVVRLFGGFLDQWREIARQGGDFHWVAQANPNDVLRLVEHWAAIDALTDEQLDALGISWSPPEGAPFFAALTSGVLDALRRHEETRRLAARLSPKWEGS